MKKIICVLSVLLLIFLTACGGTAVGRYESEDYAFDKLTFSDSARMVYIGNNELVISEDAVSGSSRLLTTRVVDLGKAKVTETRRYKHDAEHEYRLSPVRYDGGKLVYEVYFSNPDYYFGSSESLPEFFLIGSIKSKKLEEFRVQSCAGVFSFDCSKYYYPLDNTVYCTDVKTGATEVFAEFPSESTLSFASRVNADGSIYSLSVNPHGGDSYYCHLDLNTGKVSNAVFRGSNARNVGELGDYTVILKYPDDNEGPLTEQLYLVNNAGHAGDSSFYLDIGTAFSTHDALVETADVKLYSPGYLVILNSSDGNYRLKIGLIGSDFAEFADVSSLGRLNSLTSAAYADDVSVGDNNTGVFAFILDGKLHIVNPAVLNYITKIPLQRLPYVNLKLG